MAIIIKKEFTTHLRGHFGKSGSHKKQLPNIDFSDKDYQYTDKFIYKEELTRNHEIQKFPK